MKNLNDILTAAKLKGHDSLERAKEKYLFRHFQGKKVLTPNPIWIDEIEFNEEKFVIHLSGKMSSRSLGRISFSARDCIIAEKSTLIDGQAIII